MNELAIFARTYRRDLLVESLETARADGFHAIHFNYACAGLPSLPGEEGLALAESIGTTFTTMGLNMVAVSGTFNMIHPDPNVRNAEKELCLSTIRSAPLLGTGVVTLCTGTRDKSNMWKSHPDNSSPQAWADLLETFEGLIPVAEEARVSLGIEPETANVIDSAPKARRLLEELGSETLVIVLDGANLLTPSTLDRQEEVLREAVDLLGDRIAMIHAKDVTPPGSPSQAAGTGALDYDVYFQVLAEADFQGPIVLHNLLEEEVSSSRAFIQSKASAWLAPKGI